MSDAHTRLFHELMEPLLQLDLSGIQLRVVLWVARNSYGRQGAFYAAYSWRRIARDLRADRRGVARAGNELLERDILRLGSENEIGIDKNKIRSIALGRLSPGSVVPWDRSSQMRGRLSQGIPISKEKRKKPPTQISLEAEQLVDRLEKLLRKNQVRRMPSRETGLRDADLLLRVDRRPLEEARVLLQWAQADSFWRSNILSIGKFRKQYDQLRLQHESKTVSAGMGLNGARLNDKNLFD